MFVRYSRTLLSITQKSTSGGAYVGGRSLAPTMPTTSQMYMKKGLAPKMRVMSVDPGGKTGWCAINIPDKEIELSRKGSTHQLVKWCKDNGEMRWAEISAGPVRTAVQLVELCGDLSIHTVLMESMYLDKPGSRKVRTGDILSPCKVGWAFAGLYEGQKIGTVIWRPPSEMSVITDARLKQWGLWIPNQKDARAALKHLMVYLRGTSV